MQADNIQLDDNRRLRHFLSIEGLDQAMGNYRQNLYAALEGNTR